ncbi:ATP-binding protein [Candidatus Micrarchaeota archaeon]|nr:ATP-binding protein [Candidatus Micrarchaeota archaeon]
MYLPREIAQKFEKVEAHYPITAIVGPRQAGKTTFLKEQGKGKKTRYVTLDDPEVQQIFDRDIKKFEQAYLEGNDITIIDEVHQGKDAGQKLKYLADQRHHLWISSSSELLLAKEVLSWLVGRVTIIELYQFSLEEFVEATQDPVTPEALSRNIWEHICYGGYPRVVISSDQEIKKNMLKDIGQTLILKDVARTFQIQNIVELEKMAYLAAHSVGSIINHQKIGAEIGLSFESTNKYLDAMEKSYVIRRVYPFFTNKAKEITKQPKLYFIDTGLRNSIANEFNLEVTGQMFENYVLCELIKAGYRVRYWRTKNKAEVDFVIEKEGKIIPIEVKLKQNTPTIERSFRAFLETYKIEKGYVVYYQGNEAEFLIGNTKIKATNIRNLIKELKVAKIEKIQ